MAHRILAKLHSSTGDLQSPLVQLEMEEIAEKIGVQGHRDETEYPLLVSSDPPTERSKLTKYGEFALNRKCHSTSNKD